jgi:hypothetical protein
LANEVFFEDIRARGAGAFKRRARVRRSDNAFYRDAFNQRVDNDAELIFDQLVVPADNVDVRRYATSVFDRIAGMPEFEGLMNVSGGGEGAFLPKVFSSDVDFQNASHSKLLSALKMIVRRSLHRLFNACLQAVVGPDANYSVDSALTSYRCNFVHNSQRAMWKDAFFKDPAVVDLYEACKQRLAAHLAVQTPAALLAVQTPAAPRDNRVQTRSQTRRRA